ncbi:MAG: DNA-binding protein [Spirochaetaceae bacterium]|nr:MAG: DNA-binding protein [Spirochaetaceae bacterium]
MRVFLDANILFSASWSDGPIRRLLADLHEAGHVCIADGYVWSEAERNLIAHRSRAVAELHKLGAGIELHSRFAGEGVVLDDTGLPDKSARVLASAVALSCDALVTGDRTHFGALWGTTINGVRVLSPRMLAEAFWG